ncbi:hypothetical protein, partial [Leuconostoc mesenteroides]
PTKPATTTSTIPTKPATTTSTIPTKPATTTSTSTDDTTDRNGQHTSGKGALAKTAATIERPAFGFLGVIVVSLMGVLGLKRKQREE